jgi:nicotinamide-nucleotide amidase
MLASRLTEVPGASAFLDRATVAYSNEAKVEVLGVSPEVLARHGAVSEEAARAMAEGARARAHADVGVAVTGIAGPGGGTEDKPVGLVFIALSGSAGDLVRRFHFPGDRDRVRRQACQAALDLLRRGLLPA